MRRAFIIAFITGAYWAGSVIAPGLMSKTALGFFMGLFAILFGSCMFILPKISDLSTIEGLGTREREYLMVLLKEIRSRVWWVVGISAVGSCMIFFLGSASLPDRSPVKPLGIGFMLGLGVSYLIVLAGWYNEIHDFSDQIRLREERKHKRDNLLKRIEDGTGSSVSS